MEDVVGKEYNEDKVDWADRLVIYGLSTLYAFFKVETYLECKNNSFFR